MNLVLGNAEHQEQCGAIHVWRLRGHVKLQSAHRVKFGDATARLEWRGVTARKNDVFFDDHFARLECGIGGALIANVPVVNVVRFALAVVPQDHVILHGFVRIDHNLERFVIDLDEFGHVVGGLSGLGVTGGDLLVLVQNLAVRQDHLLVEAVEGWQPTDVVRIQLFARDDRDRARNFHGLGRVDSFDVCVRVRTVNQGHVQLPFEVDVVNVIAFALQETRVFFAFH